MIAVAFLARPQHRSEWQAVLQAASWRAHFGHSVSIHVFVERSDKALLARRVAMAFETMGCQVRALSGGFRTPTEPAHKASIGLEPFDEEKILICDTHLFVNKSFSLEFLAPSTVAAIAEGAAQELPDEYRSSQALKFWSATGLTAPQKIDPAALPACQAEMLGYYAHSDIGKIYAQASAHILALTDNAQAKEAARWLPGLMSQGYKQNLHLLNPTEFGVHPRDNANPNVAVFKYAEISDLYQTGLNAQASAVLADTASGFKNLMDLLQKRNDLQEAGAQASRLPQPLPAGRTEPATLGVTPFVIIGAMRTGSNLLQDYLNQCNEVQCHGEIFNSTFIGGPDSVEFFGITMAQRDLSPRTLLNALLAHKGQAKSIGFRFFDSHMEAGLNEWMSLPGAKAIILTRNPLDSYISLQTALKTKQWLLRNASERQLSQWVFDPSDFLDYCSSLAQFYGQKIHDLAISGTPYFHIKYRELFDQSILAELAKYLHASAPKAGFVQNMVKQITGHPSELIINFDAVADAERRARLMTPQLDWDPVER